LERGKEGGLWIKNRGGLGFSKPFWDLDGSRRGRGQPLSSIYLTIIQKSVTIGLNIRE
jgi:hypothetical protein